MIPRSALAVKLGISTDRLFAYENGRAKLPWAVGNRACEILDISQDWLAGHLSDTLGVYLPIELSNVPAETLMRGSFLEVFEEHFAFRARALRSEASVEAGALITELVRLGARARKDPSLLTPELLAELRSFAADVQRAHERASRRIS